jgi:hypothetical protein
MNRFVKAAKARYAPPPLERVIQKDIIKLLERYRMRGQLEYFATLPEGKRNPKRAGWAKALGMRKGVPDIVVLVGGFYRESFNTLPLPGAMFLEVKREGGVIGASQRAWEWWLKEAGFSHAYVRSVQDVQEILDEVVNEPLREDA